MQGQKGRCLTVCPSVCLFAGIWSTCLVDCWAVLGRTKGLAWKISTGNQKKKKSTCRTWQQINFSSIFFNMTPGLRTLGDYTPICQPEDHTGTAGTWTRTKCSAPLPKLCVFLLSRQRTEWVWANQSTSSSPRHLLNASSASQRAVLHTVNWTW